MVRIEIEFEKVSKFFVRVSHASASGSFHLRSQGSAASAKRNFITPNRPSGRQTPSQPGERRRKKERAIVEKHMFYLGGGAQNTLAFVR